MSVDEVVELRRLLDDVKTRVQRMLKETWRAPGAAPSTYDWQRDARELLKLLIDKSDHRIPVRGKRRRDAGRTQRRQ
jgi:hypothetical protein